MPPLAAGKIPETWVVNPTLPQDEAVATPPEINTLPVATEASADRVLLAVAWIKSPVVYEVNPVPPLVVAIVVALHVPVAIVPKVVIVACPT